MMSKKAQANHCGGLGGIIPIGGSGAKPRKDQASVFSGTPSPDPCRGAAPDPAGGDDPPRTPAIICLCWLAATAATAAPCDRHTALESWLAVQAGSWEARLAPMAGYEAVGPVVVCRARQGTPRVAEGRIHLPTLPEEEARLSLAHEYVHLAFRHHPAARNERFVERLARWLVLGEELP